MIRKTIIIALSIGVVLFLITFVYIDNGNRLKIFFLDVGQGDAILIRTPDNQDILIDGGPGSMVVDELGKYLPFYDRDIELMILTHAHSDHVAGLVEVLKRYEIDQVLYSGNVKSNAPDYLAWLDLISEKSIPLNVTNCCDTYRLGEELILQMVFPFEDLSGKEIEDLNASSIISRLVYKEREFLFTGDAPIEVEDELMGRGIDINSDVLKVGHHGSKYSSGEDFLQRVNPEYAVIQSGEGNSYGHPNFMVINNLQKQGIKILRNDQCGTIILTSDGISLDIKSERCK